jgi:hypothetical protein
VLDALKYALTRVGELCDERVVHNINAAANYIEVGRWMRARGFEPQRLRSREELFARAAAEIADRKVLYLEFGVFQGASMREWSRLLRHPQAMLHGFDSFEGLPQDWNAFNAQGMFRTDGVPQIDDPRVHFHRGWFNQTLPSFQIPPHESLVINVDADLYSSTCTVLDALVLQMRPGTYIYFDEFSDRQHELRAFDEFLKRTGFAFSVVGATRELSHVMFRRI